MTINMSPASAPNDFSYLNGVQVIGPDYWQYPNRMFSDPAHLNPHGAEIYTRDLWNLVKRELN